MLSVIGIPHPRPIQGTLGEYYGNYRIYLEKDEKIICMHMTEFVESHLKNPPSTVGKIHGKDNISFQRNIRHHLL